ncbi:hypothetical protein PILCRDRAFT_51494, partial [Piloderma croceum F 1598]
LSSKSDPLVHHGRHFCRTIHAMCNIHALLTQSIIRAVEQTADDDLSDDERREHRVFKRLLNLVPNLEERIMTGSEEELTEVADLLRKGATGARGDDTKTLKGNILEWITPKGESLNPPLYRNQKADRGFHHERTGALLCPVDLDWSHEDVKKKLRSGEDVVTGDRWPLFIYADCKYDPEDPWNGLLRGDILVNAFKHVFTSPSSVDKEHKATRSGNARLHNMTRTSPASVAYIATQVRFALSSSSVFSRTDTVTDSERFYNSLLEILDDPAEKQEVDALFKWWD